VYIIDCEEAIKKKDMIKTTKKSNSKIYTYQQNTNVLHHLYTNLFSNNCTVLSSDATTCFVHEPQPFSGSCG